MPHSLETRFWKLASNQASLEGYSFAPDCERYLRAMISHGVKNILREGFENDKKRIRKAEDNLQRFVRMMAEEATQRGFPLLKEDTFYTAQRLLCPLWPFC